MPTCRSIESISWLFQDIFDRYDCDLYPELTSLNRINGVKISLSILSDLQYINRFYRELLNHVYTSKH